MPLATASSAASAYSDDPGSATLTIRQPSKLNSRIAPSSAAELSGASPSAPPDTTYSVEPTSAPWNFMNSCACASAAARSGADVSPAAARRASAAL